MRKALRTVPVTLVCFCFIALSLCATASTQTPAADDVSEKELEQIEQGRLIYQQGKLPSGATIKALIHGDIELPAEQAICTSCHRRSGLGSSEGQEVVPPITGDILYAPLRLPASKPPLPPLLRPAYTDATLKLAITDGVDANGKLMSAFMPRYPLTDAQLDSVLLYLKSLDTDSAPGVGETNIHFATVIADTVAPEQRKALLDVLQTFIEQKNTETRYETKRAEQTPWHKDWLFKPYRKWILHVWDLSGPADQWPEQMAEHYRQQPVFAILSGIAPGSWQPIHNFCESSRIPCLFPMTSLPVVNEQDFYSVYLNRGMMLEGEAIIQHLFDDGLLDGPVFQVYRLNDPEGQAAAQALQGAMLRRGGSVTNITLPDNGGDLSSQLSRVGEDAVVVLWLPESDLAPMWRAGNAPAGRTYLSSTLYGDPATVPEAVWPALYWVHPSELPAGLPRLLARSTGWLRAKRIYSSQEQEAQADAFFTLKIAAGALRAVGTYFNRDFFLESLEHMVDNATYTSVYPRISLAPDQRFVAKGVYIARISEDASGVRLEAVSDWLIPNSR